LHNLEHEQPLVRQSHSTSVNQLQQSENQDQTSRVPPHLLAADLPVQHTTHTAPHIIFKKVEANSVYNHSSSDFQVMKAIAMIPARTITSTEKKRLYLCLVFRLLSDKFYNTFFIIVYLHYKHHEKLKTNYK